MAAPERTGKARADRRARRVRTIGAIAVAVVVVGALGVRLADGPLRAQLERRVNASLNGYRATIDAVRFHPLGFSIDLLGVRMMQTANPDPPVLDVPKLHASVQWKALLFGRLVADMALDRPKLHVNTKQTETEVRSATPVRERGWQDAVQAIYPLKINLFRVNDAELEYIDQGPFKPIHMTHVNVRAENIRNVRSRPHEYPSPIHVDGVLFDRTKLVVDGNADILAEPQVAGSVHVDLEGLAVEYLQPIFRRYGITARRGLVSLAGDFESAADRTNVNLANVDVSDLDLDYASAQQAPAAQVAQKTADAAVETNANPTAVVRAARVRVSRSTIGFTNRGTDPPYRIVFADNDIRLDDFSNQLREQPAKLRWSGRFMDSGALRVDGTFRPDVHGPDFDLGIRIENTDVRKMNDLFRAYGKFDVAGGRFSFYSELHVKDGWVHGYVKPLFVDLDVLDADQDSQKSFVQKFYQAIVAAVAGVLTNRPRDQVATETTISGPLQGPSTNTWQVVVRLVQNAFIKAIAPGLQRETTATR